MSSDRASDRTPPDSDPDDELYTETEEGKPRMAGRNPDNEGVYWGFPDDSARIVDPKVYGTVLLLAAALLLFPEPFSSGIGLVLFVLGGFVALVDFLT